MLNESNSSIEQKKYYFFASMFTLLSIISYFAFDDKKIWITLGFIACLQVAEKITIRPNQKTAFYTSYYFAPAMSSFFPLHVILLIALFSFSFSFLVADETFVEKIKEFKIKFASFTVCAAISSTTVLLDNPNWNLSNHEKIYCILVIYLLSTLAGAYSHQLLNWFYIKTYEWRSLSKVSQGVVASCAIMSGITFNRIGNVPPQYFLSTIIFYIPVISLWQSTNRYMFSEHTFLQTIDAISKAPEYAGYIPMGHSSRVKNMSLEIAKELNIPLDLRKDLAIAALLCDISVNIIEESMDNQNYDWTVIAEESGKMLEGATRFQNIKWIIEHFNDDCFDGKAKSKLKLAAEALSISKEWDRQKLLYFDDISTFHRIELEPTGKYNNKMLQIIAEKKGIVDFKSV